ncbi:acyl-CoA dehydrogenase family protein [Haloprofundus sp. MHR1]|uniref:acyl-CoA dehydrogenase family protein n=1 Tax=Haloprofundus sp. MHR1 TaxID=2572921 RepID=UPI0010BF3A89|nr:acyl-CoA dehydrogenase family protein [Haloprofundus sp. MHR1]QCJ47108.1 acyl-CoA dehydrogenase [Haloprofundus sp. MHR1]
MEYDDSERAEAVAARVREFVDETVIPVERDLLGDGPIGEDRLADLRDEARERDVYAPQISTEYGGMGMQFRDVLPAFEEAGRSLLAAPAIRVDAPDEGNMHTFELVATEEQKEEWLRPLVAGEIRSGFCMTEPMQGGGSDPKMLKTEARKEGDEWVINGHKWWTTNGLEADILLVMARTDFDAHPYSGCSIILVPADTPGVEVERGIPHMADGLLGTSHAEIKFDDVRVPVENLMGEENEGFSIAQQRLGPARLTHCMRYSGMAQRALDVAKAYTSQREAFGSPVAEKQGIRFSVAEAETELHAARCMVRHAADRITAGDEARIEVSMSKLYTSNVVQEAIDTAMQMCGANAVGEDLPLADFYQNVRQFRFVDGADEVHKRVIARDAFSEIDDSELENVTRYEE